MILSKERRRDFETRIRDITAHLRRDEADVPLSLELFTTGPDNMIAQAEQSISTFGDYKSLAIKVPIWNELRVIDAIRCMGARVNCTCCMSYNQAIMAALAGANDLPLFWGAFAYGSEAATVVRQVKQRFKEQGSEAAIIVGSIRQDDRRQPGTSGGRGHCDGATQVLPADVRHGRAMARLLVEVVGADGERTPTRY